MKNTLLVFLASILLASSLIASSANAQVKSSLVSPSAEAAPVTSVVVAVKLDHQPGWHTYWKNPGTGKATEVNWSLPDGWIADQIDWPVPSEILTKDGKISGHGYEGTVYLPVRLLVPASAKVGTVAELKASVEWLMCEYEFCIPGGDEVSLSLPIVSTTPAQNASITAALKVQAMPQAGEGLKVSVSRTGTELVLRVSGLSNVSTPHFFSHTEIIWHDSEQKFSFDKDILTATLEIDSYWENDIDHLSGVLTYTDSDGVYQGQLVSAPIEIAALSNTMSPVVASSVLKAVLFAFLGGIILNLMPCVLPILSLKVLSITKATSGNQASVRQEMRRDGFLYTAGVLACFLVIAVVLLIMRAVLGVSGWGFQLQNPAVVLTLALLFVLIGLNLLGVFEIGNPMSRKMSNTGQNLSQKKGWQGSFFTGVLAVVVATPCTAPFMASAVGFALLQPALIAIIIFLALGLGLAAPYLLLCLVPGSRRILPKPGQWMVVLRQILAFPMFLTSIWLLWVLGSQSGTNGMAMGLIAIVLLGIAVWAFGVSTQAKRGYIWKGITGAALILVLATVFSFTKARSSTTEMFEIVDYTPARLETLLTDGDPVFVYFTADWCITCKVNERVAIKVESTAAYFKQAGIRVVVGDWTNADPAITKVLSSYERAGVPMYLYFVPGSRSDQGVLLPQTLTPGILRKAIEAAGDN